MKKLIGLIFCVHLVGGYVLAQVPFFHDYSLLRRNEPIQINTIFQDSSGFIWYGTNKGLFRFDGVNIERYTMADSLPENQVTALAQDSLGRIWTGHKNGKLAFLENGKFKIFDPEEGTSANEISDILFDRYGNLWFSTYNDGLYYFTQQRLFRLDEDDGLPDIFIYDLIEDPAGHIWAGTDGGAAICRLTDKKVRIRVLDYAHGLPDNIIKKIVIDDNHTVWLATEDAGIISFDPTRGTTKSLIDGDWRYGAITDFCLSGNQVWIATAESGLVIYDVKTNQYKMYGNSTGFDLMAINSLLTDKEGNIWIGTKSGVVRTLGDYVEYIDGFDPYNERNVLAVTVDASDNIWYSTREGLFKRSIDEKGRPKIEKQLQSSPFTRHTTISLYTDSMGYVWAGMYGEGLLRINPATGKAQHMLKELKNGNILNIAGNGKVIWLATLGGVSQITVTGDEFKIKNYSHEDGLISDYVYQVFIDSKKRVWFATDGRGVGMLDGEGFHHYEKGLNSKVVYGFAEDDKNRIWINVPSEGLYRLENDSFQPLTSSSPLRDKNINCLTSDLFGNLIVMHDLGIDIYTTKNKVRYLGEEVGIGNRKPNLNALTKDRRGRIYFGTDEGIVSYADANNDLLTLPGVLIAGLKVQDRNVPITAGYNFSYDQNSVTIGYLGFWYQNPGNLNYQYMLENYDRDWISTRERSATYSSLPPGTYTFKVKASDTEDFAEASETSFSFSIRPPFWKTIWFYVISASLVIVAASAYINNREKKLQEDKRILEEKVKARTLEIKEQADEIQAQNEEIQSQAEEIMGINDNLEELVKARTAELERKNKAAEESQFIIAHELRAPVASVLGLVNLISKCELSDEAKTIVTHMENSAERLNVVVRTITKAIERGDKK